MTSPAIRSITRNAAYLTGTRAVKVLSRLVWVIFAARILGPDLYALLAYSLAWQLTFLPLALFGIGPVLSYLLGPDRSRAPEYAANALAIRLVTIIVASTACVGLSHVITPDPRAPELIAILSLVLSARALTTHTHTLFTAFEINQYTMRQEMVFSFLDVAIALGILLTGGDLIMLVTAKAILAWIQTAWTFSVAHRLITPIRLNWQPANWRPLLILSLPAMMISFAADWRFNGSLVLFRNMTTDGPLFSQYALAMQSLAIAAILPVSLGRAAFPALRRAVARGDGKELLFAHAMQRAAPVIGTTAGLLGWAFGEPVFRWLLGEPFSTAGELAGLTLWCLIPMTAAIGYPEALLAQGRFRAIAIISIAGATVMTILTFVLVPIYGVHGAIAAALLGFSVLPATTFALAWRQQQADLIDEVIRPFAAAALALGACMALASFSRWAALIAGLLTLAAATLALHVVGPTEIRAIRARISSS